MAKRKVNASVLIREALDEGVTKPAEIIAYVQSKHGVEVSSGLVAGVKNKWSKKQSETPEGFPLIDRDTPQAGKVKKETASGLSPIDKLQNLVDQLGADTVKKLLG